MPNGVQARRSGAIDFIPKSTISEAPCKVVAEFVAHHGHEPAPAHTTPGTAGAARPDAGFVDPAEVALAKAKRAMNRCDVLRG